MITATSKYESKDYGINLEWSDISPYEWQFRREGMSGPVHAEEPVGLFDNVADNNAEIPHQSLI